MVLASTMPAALNPNDRTVVRPAQPVRVLREADVVVAGGSPTGVAAAVAAARCGANTLLIERFGFLGGQMTAGLMLTLHRPFWDRRGNRVVGGLPVELLERVIRLGGTADTVDMLAREGAPFWGDGWTATALDPETTKRALFAMAQEAGVTLLLDTWIADAVMAEGSVAGVVLETRTGPTAVLGNTTVDATGDAHVAAQAGAEFDYRHPNHFPPNLVARIAGLELASFADYVAHHYEHLDAHPPGLDARAFADHVRSGAVFGVIGFRELTDIARQEGLLADEQLRLGFLHTGSGHCMLWRNNLARVDSLDTYSMSNAHIEGRRRVWAAVEFYRRFVPGMRNIRLMETATALGVRESRRVLGTSTLTEADVLGSRRLVDVVCRSAGHDSHNQLKDGVCDVPYGALLPQTVDGLLIAGRAISCTVPHALDSIRGVVPCMSVGQSAGVAAALAAQRGCTPRNVPIHALQAALRDQGVLL